MKAADTQDVKNLLLRNHEQYRELAERHHQLDDRLHELTERHFLSDTEQVEESTLKKRKLALKDQMEMIFRDYAALRSLTHGARTHPVGPGRFSRRLTEN